MTRQTTVSYTNLPAGEYVFQVISCNNDRLWNTEPASFAFTIKPPFSQTVWFYAMVSLVASAGVVSYIRVRTRILRKQKQVLEQNVEQRTAELKEAIEELKSTQAQLVEREKLASLGQMAAGIAHEIQNPLNFVNNFSELSAELIADAKSVGDDAKRLEVLDELKDLAQRINQHGKRAEGIVKGMMMHSQAGVGNRQLSNIHALCDEALKPVWHGQLEKNPGFECTVEKRYDPAIPLVNVMARDISRVIFNLLSNAFFAVKEKAAKSDAGYCPCVSLATSFRDGLLLITVKDNGAGIPHGLRDKIFEPFFTTRPGLGTGLGLNISYTIVKAHGGEIRVTGNEGQGMEFEVTLPV
jgi:signal transduction histidine kinase